MINIKLPFWLSAEQTEKLITAGTAWWHKVEAWIGWPMTQFDPLTCSVGVLNLLAFQRDIQRFAGEPESLFRLRVNFAFINAQDAGSKAGFIRIFERLGIGYIEIDERVDPIDWDVILLLLSDSQLADNIDLLQHIIYKYGRTCRRYQLTVLTPIVAAVDAREMGHQYDYMVAREQIEPWLADTVMDAKTMGNVWATDIAKL